MRTGPVITIIIILTHNHNDNDVTDMEDTTCVTENASVRSGKQKMRRTCGQSITRRSSLCLICTPSHNQT